MSCGLLGFFFVMILMLCLGMRLKDLISFFVFLFGKFVDDEKFEGLFRIFEEVELE